MSALGPRPRSRARASETRPAAAASVSNGPAAPALGSDLEEVLRLQRTAGNQALTALITGRVSSPATGLLLQRADRGSLEHHKVGKDDAALVPSKADAPALAAELATLKAKEVAFAKGTGPDLDDKEKARRKELGKAMWLRTVADEEETLKGNPAVKAANAAAWFADVKDYPFLGRSVRVHKELADRLKMAEADFLKAVGNEKPPDGGWLKGAGGLREPAQGLHSFGLAIDINASTNPWIINPSGSSYGGTGEPRATSQGIRDIIDRAVLLVLGKTAAEESFGTRPEGTDKDKRVTASYEKLSAASGALKTYFELAGPTRKRDLQDFIAKLGAKDPKKGNLEAWVKTIKADKRTLEASAANKQWSNPTEGFLDLDQRLVTALTDSTRAGLTWLGDATVAHGRDIMHFDTRGVGPIKRIWKSTTGAWTSLGEG